MFQPTPTPLWPFQMPTYGVDVTNSDIPDYGFAPTPQYGLGTGQESNGGNGAATLASFPGPGANATANRVSVLASPVFNGPLPSANHNPHQFSLHRAPPSHLPPHNYQHIKMEQDDIAAQEAAAREYEPKLEGPLVGEKTSSHVITEEYAKADPTYVAKTLALPQTYSHYRPIQGDGNCGWRAIGFGFFECLIQCGDVNRFQVELARLTSLDDYVESVGCFQRDIFEDFNGMTLEMMDDIIKAMSSGQDAMAILWERFNDSMTSSAIVYHLRLLAASWLKGNAEMYEDFLGQDVTSYCNEWILPANKEIEHLGVVLLYNVLLKPADIVLEIAYLDRSEGDQVNVHRNPDEANGRDAATLGPMICLLYRPGHYDILYRQPVIPLPPAPSASISLQVNRVTSFSHQSDIQASGSALATFADMTPLALIPGFSPATLTALPPNPVASPPMAEVYTPSPQSSWAPTPPFPDAIPPVPQEPSPPQQQGVPPPNPPRMDPVRFSKYNYPLPGVADATGVSSEPTFTTSTFKNSHFNVAHYNNPHFQPEEYKPDNDDDAPTGKPGRKRS